MRLLHRCKHKYQYYNAEPDINFWGEESIYFARYKFVCTKCGRVITIRQLDIENELEKYRDYFRKQEALGQNMGYTDARIELPTNIRRVNHLFQGNYVSAVIEVYKERGIDLMQVAANEICPYKPGCILPLQEGRHYEYEQIPKE